MNRKDLADQIAKEAKIPKITAQQALNIALRAIMDAVAKGEAVTLARFGTFSPKARKAGRKVNPKTRQPIQVPSKVVPRFKAGKDFKDVVAKNLRAEAGSEGKLQIMKR